MAKAAHLKPHQFQPGQCANPSGRPRGARNKLTERFLEDVHAAWQEHGETALKTLAENDPGKLATIVAGLVPKDVYVNVGLGDQLSAMLEAMQEMQETPPEVVNGEAVEILETVSDGDAMVTLNDGELKSYNNISTINEINS